MENNKKCPVCSNDMFYNGEGLAKNPKAPTYKCTNTACKFSWDKNTGQYIPSEFRTGVWDNQVPQAPNSPQNSPQTQNNTQTRYMGQNSSQGQIEPKTDWDKISWGKCKHAYLVEAYKVYVLKDNGLADLNLIERCAEEWADMSMRRISKEKPSYTPPPTEVEGIRAEDISFDDRDVPSL